MAKIRRRPQVKSRAAIKQALGATRKAASTDRPGTKATAQIKKRRPVQRIPFKKGFGEAFDVEDIAKRKRQFQRQQRENKLRARSIVRRDVSTGRQAAGRSRFARGVRVATKRLKQFAEFGQLEVIREQAVSSSWVRMIHLVQLGKQPALAISFHDGFTALYPTTNIRDYEAMSRAASKGGYIWATLYFGRPGQGAPYQSVSF